MCCTQNRQLEVRRLLRMPNDGGEQDVHIRHKLQLEKDCLETALLIEQRVCLHISKCQKEKAVVCMLSQTQEVLFHLCAC